MKPGPTEATRNASALRNTATACNIPRRQKVWESRVQPRLRDDASVRQREAGSARTMSFAVELGRAAPRWAGPGLWCGCAATRRAAGDGVNFPKVDGLGRRAGVVRRAQGGAHIWVAPRHGLACSGVRARHPPGV